MFCFFVSHFPVIKKLSALFLVCRIIKVSFRLSETRQLWEHNIRAVLKISVQWSASSVQRPASRAQSPESRVQRPESSVQSLASRVQSPTSRVQRPTLAFRVQEFRYARKKLHAWCLKSTCWFSFFTNSLHIFKMSLNEYFLNSWHHNCETSMKMY